MHTYVFRAGDITLHKAPVQKNEFLQDLDKAEVMYNSLYAGIIYLYVCIHTNCVLYLCQHISVIRVLQLNV